MQIRVARPREFEQVRNFYHSLIDAMRDAPYRPGWEKGVYPADDDLRDALGSGTLFIGTEADAIVCAMIVNHACNKSYAEIDWPTRANPDEVTVIHALGVHPDFSGRGYAKALVAHAIELAAAGHQKVIRLDVLDGNLPAERLYAGMDFRLVGTAQMYYADTGWTAFRLYEYPLTAAPL